MREKGQGKPSLPQTPTKDTKKINANVPPITTGRQPPLPPSDKKK